MLTQRRIYDFVNGVGKSKCQRHRSRARRRGGIGRRGVPLPHLTGEGAVPSPENYRNFSLEMLHFGEFYAILNKIEICNRLTFILINQKTEDPIIFEPNCGKVPHPAMLKNPLKIYRSGSRCG